MLLRLSEVLFIEVIRRYLDSLAAERTGWLSGLRDPIVGHALALLHDRPTESWTLEQLAKDVGVSRTALADRFTHLVGQPPMRYLARWRMQLASRLLLDGSAKVPRWRSTWAITPRPRSAAPSRRSSGYRPQPGAGNAAARR